jgi:hypothetical protein
MIPPSSRRSFYTSLTILALNLTVCGASVWLSQRAKVLVIRQTKLIESQQETIKLQDQAIQMQRRVVKNADETVSNVKIRLELDQKIMARSAGVMKWQNRTIRTLRKRYDALREENVNLAIDCQATDTRFHFLVSNQKETNLSSSGNGQHGRY